MPRDTRTYEELNAALEAVQKKILKVINVQAKLMKPALDHHKPAHKLRREATKLNNAQLRKLGLNSFARFKLALARHYKVDEKAFDGLRASRNEQYSDSLATKLWKKLHDEVKPTAASAALEVKAGRLWDESQKMRRQAENSDEYRALNAQYIELRDERDALRAALDRFNQRQQAADRKRLIEENPDLGGVEKLRTALKAMLAGTTLFSFDGKRITLKGTKKP